MAKKRALWRVDVTFKDYTTGSYKWVIPKTYSFGEGVITFQKYTNDEFTNKRTVTILTREVVEISHVCI